MPKKIIDTDDFIVESTPGKKCYVHDKKTGFCIARFCKHTGEITDFGGYPLIETIPVWSTWQYLVLKKLGIDIPNEFDPFGEV